ncbi:MAG: radical SAM protein [Candidatus Izemoplasmatales bacterium]|nr:radical SAM protein [Candidatus Izemoplasmatales bacterium]
MNILLINPPDDNLIECYAYSNGEVGIDSPDFGKFPSLGLLYILGYLEKYSPEHNLFIIDCIAEKITYDVLKSKILQIQPDLVGITSFSIALIDVIKTANIVRELFPKAHICMGGHHPMAFPLEAVKLKEFDSIIIGDGEKPFCELAKAIDNNESIDKIIGLYTKESILKYVNNDNDKKNEDSRFLHPVCVEPSYVENIDDLPFPARKYLSHIKFFSIVGVSKKFTTIISSRGCPFHCIMCDVPYKKYRARSIKNIVDEIEECTKEGYKEFHFYDDMFNITPDRIIDFSNELISRKLRIIWDFRGRVNTVTRESLEIAKRSGLRMISFGVETGTNDGLEYIKKDTTVEKIKEVFKICNDLKIKTIADYMLGFPFEKTEDDINKSIDFCISLKPTYGMFSVLILFPNTPIYHEALEKKLIDPGRWQKFCSNPTKDFYVDYWEEYFTRKQLLDFQQKAFNKFYLRLEYIWRSIKNLSTFNEFIMKTKGFFLLIKK